MSISNVAAPDTSDARNSLTAAQSTAAAAQAKVSEIQTRILKLQQEILDATMTASIDGVVTSLNAEEGEETDGTEPLVVVSDLNDTVVTAELTTDEVQSVEPGQTVTMNMYTMDGSELPLTGVVDSVSPEPSQNTGSQGSLTTFKAIITVDSIEGQAISSGMMVDYKNCSCRIGQLPDGTDFRYRSHGGWQYGCIHQNAHRQGRQRNSVR